MAIPLLFIGIALISAAGGVGSAAKGGMNQYKAGKINEDADTRLEESASRLNVHRYNCSEAIQSLGKEKVFVLNNSMKRFVNIFSQIKNVDFRNSEGLEELSKLKLDKSEFEEVVKLTHITESLLEGTVAGTASGAVAAFGAYGAAMAFATASTGTAISTLSGVAATNATLAFFGGGSLAAGGLGIAGGTAVLGGLVAGPALLVMGLIVNAKTGKNLEKAKEYAAQADMMISEYDAGSEECIAIRRRSYMFYNLLARLDSMFLPQIYEMEKVIENEGNDYTLYSVESKRKIAIAASTAATIKSVLNTPILSEDGSLTDASKEMIQKMIA